MSNKDTLEGGKIIDWSKAPEWANYHTFDLVLHADQPSGQFWQNRPVIYHEKYFWEQGALTGENEPSLLTLPAGADWRLSLSIRPDPDQVTDFLNHAAIDLHIAPRHIYGTVVLDARYTVEVVGVLDFNNRLTVRRITEKVTGQLLDPTNSIIPTVLQTYINQVIRDAS